jgi:hypothetical protein
MTERGRERVLGNATEGRVWRGVGASVEMRNRRRLVVVRIGRWLLRGLPLWRGRVGEGIVRWVCWLTRGVGTGCRWVDTIQTILSSCIPCLGQMNTWRSCSLSTGRKAWTVHEWLDWSGRMSCDSRRSRKLYSSKRTSRNWRSSGWWQAICLRSARSIESAFYRSLRRCRRA